MASIGIPARSHPVAAEWRIVCAPRVAGVTIPPRSNALRAIALTTPDPLIDRKGALRNPFAYCHAHSRTGAPRPFATNEVGGAKQREIPPPRITVRRGALPWASRRRQPRHGGCKSECEGRPNVSSGSPGDKADIVGAMQRAHDVAQGLVDPAMRRIPGACRSTSVPERLVKTPCVFHGTDAGRGVGQYDDVGLKAAPRLGRDLLPSKRIETAQAHSHWPALTNEVDRSDKPHLARRASSAVAASALPAPVRIIELHPPAQRVRVVVLLHHLHQFVLELLGGVVAHCQLPRQLRRRNFVLRLRPQYMARNHVRRGSFEAARTVPAVGETWCRQLRHRNSTRL